MHSLKFDSFTVSVIDYCFDDSLLALDIDLENQASIQIFLNFYQNHSTDSSAIDYELDDASYHGHFGAFIFDTQSKARLYMTTEPDDHDFPSSYGIFNRNVISILNAQKSALKTIVDVLNRNNLLNNLDSSFLSECLPDNDYGDEMYQKVSSLESYLKITKQTLDDIRNE